MDCHGNPPRYEVQVGSADGRVLYTEVGVLLDTILLILLCDLG